MNHVIENDFLVDSDRINVDALDSICVADIETVSIIKIDVEVTKKVLNGVERILNNSALNVIIMEVFISKLLVQFMEVYVFKLYKYAPKSRNLTVLNNYEERGNGIFIRNLELT